VYRAIIWLLTMSAWAVCLRWALLLEKLPAATFGEHSVCGPWGCGPPIPVLLACHTFWLVLLGPPAFLAAAQLPSKWVRRLGGLMVAFAAVGLIAVGGWEAATWFREASEWERPYVVHRYFFELVTLVDVPILEALFLGGGLLLVEQWRLGRPVNPEARLFDDRARSSVEPSAQSPLS
jgi:hypothetical protein